MSTIWGWLLGLDWLSIAIKVAAAVMVGLITQVIRLNMPRIVEGIRQIAYSIPAGVRDPIFRFVDRLFPSLAITFGRRRGRYTLEWRLANCRKRRGSNFFHLIGPAYLDLTLAPIEGTTLRPSEVSNLDALRVEAGGSAIYVGYYLRKRFRRYSSLYTRLGTRDEIRKELKSLIKRQRWVKHFERTTDPNAQSAVSIHLMQRDKSYYSTFTHRGAASGLGWDPHLKTIQRRGRRGGCLVITGFFRTNLAQDLCESMSQISPRMLVVLDNGQFTIEEHARDVPTLVDALSSNLIDVYICSFEELRAVMAFGGCDSPEGSSVEAALHKFHAADLLPRITVIRESVSRRGAVAHLAVDGVVEEIVVTPDKMPDGVAFTGGRNSHRPGTRNALTAGIAYGMATASADVKIPEVARSAVERGLGTWLQECG